jgi:MFS family permease
MVLALAVGQQILRRERGKEPLVELGLLRVQSLRRGLLLVVAFFMGTSPYFFIQPLYLQVGLGHTPLAAGLAAIPFSVTCALGSRWVGRASARFGRSLLVVGALGMLVQDALLFLVAGTHGPGLWEISLPLAFGGFAYGVFFAACYAYTLGDVPVGSAATASGFLPTVQQVAGSVGTALVGMVFFAALGTTSPGTGAPGGDPSAGYATGFRHGLVVEAALHLVAALLALGVPRRTRVAGPPDRQGSGRRGSGRRGSDEAGLEAGLAAP